MTNQNIETVLLSHEIPNEARREIERLLNEEVEWCNWYLSDYLPGGVLEDRDDKDEVIADGCSLRDGDINLVFDQMSRS